MMHPRVWELFQYLNEEGAYLYRTVSEIPFELTALKPTPESYSVADVVQHLAITESRIVRLLQKAIADARAQNVGPDPETSPILPSIDVSKVLDRSTKIRNPRADPTEFKPVGHALGDWSLAGFELEMLIMSNDLPNLGAISFPHPAFGPLNGYQWLAFVGAHTHRHTDQIKEIVRMLQAQGH